MVHLFKIDAVFLSATLLHLCCKETSQGFNEGLPKHTKAVEGPKCNSRTYCICILHMKVSVSSKEAFQFPVDISDSWEKPSDLQ